MIDTKEKETPQTPGVSFFAIHLNKYLICAILYITNSKRESRWKDVDKN